MLEKTLGTPNSVTDWLLNNIQLNALYSAHDRGRCGNPKPDDNTRLVDARSIPVVVEGRCLVERSVDVPYAYMRFAINSLRSTFAIDEAATPTTCRGYLPWNRCFHSNGDKFTATGRETRHDSTVWRRMGGQKIYKPVAWKSH